MAQKSRWDNEVEPGNEPDPPLREQVRILWRRLQWERMKAAELAIKRAERMYRFKIYSAWISGGTAVAAFVMSVWSIWPGKKP